MIAAIKAGHGVGFLPNTVLSVETDLVECFEVPQSKYSFYIAMPETLKDQPRVRVFCDFLGAQAQASKHMLEGRRA
jgi:DNA-binding transcriptional LysR family regulator